MRESSPADAMLTCVPFKMPYKFVSNPSDICEKQGNNNIKQEIKTNRNMDIITKILFDAYGDVITENDFTPSMTEEYKEVCLDKGTEAPSILRNRFVNDSNGWVSFSELKYIFKPAELSEKKIGLFLKDRGYVRILKTVVSKNDTVCYKGLKIKTEPEEEYVVEEENQSPE
jgi:hypothetical protein